LYVVGPWTTQWAWGEVHGEGAIAGWGVEGRGRVITRITPPTLAKNVQFIFHLVYSFFFLIVMFQFLIVLYMFYNFFYKIKSFVLIVLYMFYNFFCFFFLNLFYTYKQNMSFLKMKHSYLFFFNISSLEDATLIFRADNIFIRFSPGL
jgi:hypothetical protein